jgi:hypothetical protein
MAVGDISFDKNSPQRSGNVWVYTGSIEVDDATRTFAIFGARVRILDCQLMPTAGVGSARCLTNDAAGVSTNGSISVFGNHQSVENYRFRITAV